MNTLCPQDASLDVIPRECQGSIGFTLAFENYILVLIPGAILLLLTPIRIRTIWSRSVKVVSPTILQAVKTVSTSTNRWNIQRTDFDSFRRSALLALVWLY